MVTVTESFVRSKSGDDRACEDGIVLTNDFIAVIDGSTDPFGRGTDRPTPGQLAMELTAEAIRNLPPSCDAHEMVDAVTNHVHANLPLDRSAAAAAITVYSVTRREVWRVGDTRFWWQGRPTTAPSKAIDVVTSEFRAALLTARLADGISIDELRTTDPGRAAVLPLIQAQISFRNALGEWGYGAIDGTPVPSEYIDVVPVPIGVKELVLHTDGYVQSCPTLVDAEARLKEGLNADPLCIGELRGTKAWLPGNDSFDDRAYIRLVL